MPKDKKALSGDNSEMSIVDSPHGIGHWLACEFVIFCVLH
ncbi:hypothetical protein SM73_00721 [Klebsiella quasipneumoniae]|nr:hypothetical protein SM73_00721 [Klebsiella quasipneumoniae]